MEIGFWEEKWNYKVDFDCGVSEEIKKDFSSQPVVYKKLEAEPLIWNDFEKIVVDKFFEIIKNLFDVNGFKEIKIYEDQILIFSKEDYIKEISKNLNKKGPAFCQSGRVFMHRENDKLLFINHLAHELSHLLSFESSLVKDPEKCSNGFYCNLQFGYLKTIKEREYFKGLNEVATELWGHLITDNFLREDILSSKEKDELREILLYSPAYLCQLSFIDYFLNDKKNNQELIVPFFKSYIDGTNDFFEVLDKYYPRLKNILKYMTDEKESVLKAVNKLKDNMLRERITSCVSFITKSQG